MKKLLLVLLFSGLQLKAEIQKSSDLWLCGKYNVEVRKGMGVSKGDITLATLDDEDETKITLQKQSFDTGKIEEYIQKVKDIFKSPVSTSN